MKVTATASYPYNGIDLKPGDEFDTKTDKHAEILVLAGKARYAEIKEPSKEVEEAPAKTPTRGGPRGSTRAATGKKVGAMTTRRYNRRDMRATKDLTPDEPDQI